MEAAASLTLLPLLLLSPSDEAERGAASLLPSSSSNRGHHFHFSLPTPLFFHYCPFFFLLLLGCKHAYREGKRKAGEPPPPTPASFPPPQATTPFLAEATPPPPSFLLLQQCWMDWRRRRERCSPCLGGTSCKVFLSSGLLRAQEELEWVGRRLGWGRLGGGGGEERVSLRAQQLSTLPSVLRTTVVVERRCQSADGHGQIGGRKNRYVKDWTVVGVLSYFLWGKEKENGGKCRMKEKGHLFVTLVEN